MELLSGGEMIARALEDEGVDKFIASWRELLADVERVATGG